METNKNTVQTLILTIVGFNPRITLSELTKLVEYTNGLKGTRFAHITNYQSDKTDNTETANHLVNFGIRYDNVLKTDAELIKAVDLEKLDVNSHNYQYINTGTLSLEDYKQAVKEALPEAYTELLEPKKPRETNDIWLNKVLVFNKTTNELSIFGQGVKKEVVEAGETKTVKSAPKTIAKEIIKKAAGLRENSLRRYKISNLSNVTVNGETLEIA
jgi:hypothetical protein